MIVKLKTILNTLPLFQDNRSAIPMNFINVILKQDIKIASQW